MPRPIEELPEGPCRQALEALRGIRTREALEARRAEVRAHKAARRRRMESDVRKVEALITPGSDQITVIFGPSDL